MPFVARRQVNANRWHLVPRDPETRPRCFLNARDGVRYAFTRALCGEPCLDGVPELEEPREGVAELCGACECLANGEHARAVAG